MAQFTVNPHRFDPYKQFKFRIKWEGKYVAGVSEVSGLRRITEVVTYRAGGDPGMVRKSPGRTNYEPITLKRGVTHDTEFEKWANQVFNLGGAPGNEVSLASYKKDIILELLNEAGQLVIAYKIYRCWPSEYVAVEDLDSNNTSVAIESLTLENEGWERDKDVKEPKEAS